MPAMPVPVRHDQRLVPLHPQRLQALLRCPPHLWPVRLLILGPTQRIVAHRLLQLAPRRRHPRQAFQLRGRLRRGCHDPARPLSLARRQVAGLGPLHPLRALGMVGLPEGSLLSAPAIMTSLYGPLMRLYWWRLPGVGAGQRAQRHRARHETEIGVRFAGLDQLDSPDRPG